MSTDYVEVKLRASQLKLGDRLVSDDGTSSELVTRVTTRGGRTTVSHRCGHTRLTGDPLLRVLRRAPSGEAGHDRPRPCDDGSVRLVNTPRMGAAGAHAKTGHPFRGRPTTAAGRPAPVPVFLAAEGTGRQ